MYFFFVDCIIYFFVFLFNSDNGKEFIVTVVVDILKESNPNCYIVTGRPRTPRDQGSVESATMVVRQVLKCILSENCLQSIKVNWTKLLGQVMAVCNSHSGIRKNSVSSYKAVFGQKYHQQLKYNMSEMHECKYDCQRSFNWTGVSLCAPTEKSHFCCCRIGEIFWLSLVIPKSFTPVCIPLPSC